MKKSEKKQVLVFCSKIKHTEISSKSYIFWWKCPTSSNNFMQKSFCLTIFRESLPTVPGLQFKGFAKVGYCSINNWDIKKFYWTLFVAKILSCNFYLKNFFYVHFFGHPVRTRIFLSNSTWYQQPATKFSFIVTFLHNLQKILYTLIVYQHENILRPYTSDTSSILFDVTGAAKAG